jgi:hypothetical protein
MSDTTGIRQKLLNLLLLSLLASATALPISVVHAQSPRGACPLRLLDVQWKPRPHGNRLSLGQDGVLDIKFRNEALEEIEEFTAVFTSSFVTNGAIGQTTVPSEQILTFETHVRPNKISRAQIDVGPSAPGRGRLRLDRVIFHSGLIWKSDASTVCDAQVH